ncbi:AAA family ATPase [Paenibacillus sp. OV219]|uniref:AAA family ATPase n=1 Tax=Paenibacillus sp. OV219 TaxID=1884377 RepID=UPI0008B4B270|nr:AAA family ATPase [Paenibacillus sp. OV219]SEN08888.1 exonuclease SbcC [Paenibacillus sp. OV219]
MKPILLRLSGLQSYREMQEVDFEKLTEAGVFGIFGSTGSGKSTILDAVTLALYGKVERAANGTQGIMNQAEKTLSVAFTFELAGAGEKKRYRVERQFKRSGDVTVSNTISRFVELTDAGDVVIADKLADVTRCVELHIGLNMQDFTRAVVLPQGKFAEFLSLTGKDRRSMLQRLFRLERFGDGLALKLSQRMKAAEAALNEAAAEQHGLGDASSEAVAAAEARYREAAAVAAAARAALADAERLHAEQLHVRERLTALRSKEARQAELLAEAPRIAALERELARLAAAERLAPALAAAGTAAAALRAAAERREAAGLAHAARQEAATAAAAAWTAAAADGAAGEPRLALRLGQLAEAQRLEGEAAALAKSAAEGEQRARTAAQRHDSFGAEAAKAQEQLSRATAKQAELRQELKAAELTAADREKREKLGKQLQQHQHLLASKAAAQRESDAAAQQLKRSMGLHGKVRMEMEQAEADVRGQLEQLVPVCAELSEISSHLTVMGSMLPQWIERTRAEQREQERQALAAQLAAGLVEGEPCPVCGSCNHHGKHDRAIQGEADAGASHVSAWEQAQRHVQMAQLRLTPLQTKAESARERLMEAIHMDEAAESQIGWTRFAPISEAAAALADTISPSSVVSNSNASADFYSEAVEQVDLFGDVFDSCEEETALTVSVDPESVDPVSVDPESVDSVSVNLVSADPDTVDPVSINPAPVDSPLQAAALSSSEALLATQQALTALSEQIAVQEAWLQSAERGFTSSRNRLTETTRKHEQAASELRTQFALSNRASEQREQADKQLAEGLAKWQEQFGETLAPEQAEELLEQLASRENSSEELRMRLEKSVSYIEEKTLTMQESTKQAQAAELEAATLAEKLAGQQLQLQEKQGQLHQMTEGVPAAQLIAAAEQELTKLRSSLKQQTERHEAAQAALQAALLTQSREQEAERAAANRHEETSAEWEAQLARSPFENGEEVVSLQPRLTEQSKLLEEAAKFHEASNQIAAQIELLRDQLGGRSQTEEEWEAAVLQLARCREENELQLGLSAKAERDQEELKQKQERWNALETKRTQMDQLTGRLKSLQTVFRGNAFVEYVAEEQLVQVCRAASERLGFLTKRRYALEVDSGGGFVIRDDAGGGIRRPVSTLSGGETFLASLALALALSGQIQLRGKYPLQFFFLDEGFGTLDPELLDTVITALERLHNETLAVGVISHVPELRARLPRRLIVTASEPAGRGSTVALETM